MIWKKRIPILLIILLLFTACGRQAAFESAPYVVPMPEAPVEAMVEVEASGADAAFRADTTAQSALDAGQQERLIIRTADMSIVVQDTEEAMATIAEMANSNDGWVVSSNVFQYDENAKTGNMTVRIPSEGFDSFIEAIQGMSVEVTRISTTGQDVTEEYVDLSARLRNLEQTADRVRNFLDEAKDVEDALAVNQELSRLEGEIEVIKGRMKYLEQSASYSTVSIELTPDILSQPIEVGGWRPQGVARDALNSLISAMQTLVDIAIWVLIFLLPIFLIIAIPIWLVVRTIRRRSRRRKAENAQIQTSGSEDQEPENEQEEVN